MLCLEILSIWRLLPECRVSSCRITLVWVHRKNQWTMRHIDPLSSSASTCVEPNKKLKTVDKHKNISRALVYKSGRRFSDVGLRIHRTELLWLPLLPTIKGSFTGSRIRRFRSLNVGDLCSQTSREGMVWRCLCGMDEAPQTALNIASSILKKEKEKKIRRRFNVVACAGRMCDCLEFFVLCTPHF